MDLRKKWLDQSFKEESISRIEIIYVWAIRSNKKLNSVDSNVGSREGTIETSGQKWKRYEVVQLKLKCWIE